jgi:hypothetical protein
MKNSSSLVERLVFRKLGRLGDIENEGIALVPVVQTTPFSWRGLACIIGGGLCHFTFGSLYCWGNFHSYAPLPLRSDFIFPVTVLAQCLTMPFGPLILKKIGARSTLLLGSWIMAAGVYLASFADDLSTFIVCYAIMFGGGVGIAYTSPMIAGWSWMPDS